MEYSNDQLLRFRLRQIVENKRESLSKMAGGNGSSVHVKLSRQINGDTTITVDTLFLVLSRYPDISAEWLLRGVGSMFLDERYGNSVQVGTMNSGQVVAGGNVHNETTTDHNDLQSTIDKLLEQNAKLIELLANK